MGYKLAGFDVLGGVEIDPEMMRIYRKNHSPRHSYLMGVQQFRNIPNSDLPAEIFELDVLDGSPPCSSFSMAGSREDGWSEKKKFREGQAHQVLDDLFFDFIAIADKLKPKIVIAENVKGLIMGNARGYVKEIFAGFDKAGYDCQLFLFNASRMGVPQARERTFFIARNKNLKLNKFNVVFNEQIIPFKNIDQGEIKDESLRLTPTGQRWWSKVSPGNNFASVHPKGSLFNWIKVDPNKPVHTLCASSARISFHWSYQRILSDLEIIRIQTFPDDYDFLESDPRYVCAMSVPPFMMMRVALLISKALLR